ncbi:MAG TPA: helix-turn-helix domain-containing protein [Paracoccaceae bacterium]|nr:helix-turn-helix domain-containing protein [Paracoccaceae bacterium]
MRHPPAMAIPSYDLYGDLEETLVFDDVLHCESVAARSRIHDWSFVAHRHLRLHQFFWITKGGGRVTIDGIPHRFGPHVLIFVPRLVVHGFLFAPGTAGWVVTVPSTLPLPLPEGPQLLKVTGAADPPSVTGLFARIAEEHAHARPARRALLEALAVSLAVWVLRAAGGQTLPPDSARRRLMRRFTTLIEEHFREQWQVDSYARALAVTPTHLTRICREIAGRPASALIQDRLLLEARRQLAHTNLRVSAIAQDLGFADPAYFTRLFTQKVGATPTEFRAGSASRRPARGRG